MMIGATTVNWNIYVHLEGADSPIVGTSCNKKEKYSKRTTDVRALRW